MQLLESIHSGNIWVKKVGIGAGSRTLEGRDFYSVVRPFQGAKELQQDGLLRSVVLVLFSKKTSDRSLASSILLLVWTFDAKWWPNL